MQKVKGRRKPIRYKSRIWTLAERNYNAIKRECKGMLYAIKWLRSYIFSIYFIIEIDS